MEREINNAQSASPHIACIDVTEDNNPTQTLDDFIKTAPRGAKAVYFRGPYLEAYALGEYVREMHAKGHCNLVQRRIKMGRSAIFEYLMVKR